MYRSIVFLQDSEDFEDFGGTGGNGIDGFFDSENEEQLDYLMQWYQIGNSEETQTELPRGTGDHIFKEDINGHAMIVSKSFKYGYAGLCEKI